MEDAGGLLLLGFLALAAGAWLLVHAREWRAARELARARTLPDPAAVSALLDALVAAREAPDLEEEILAELGRRYAALGLSWDPDPYHQLIAQYRRLAAMSTGGAAHAALLEGQQLKQRLVARFPRP